MNLFKRNFVKNSVLFLIIFSFFFAYLYFSPLGAYLPASDSGLANIANAASSMPENQDCEAASASRCWYIDSMATGLNDGTSWVDAWTSLGAVNYDSRDGAYSGPIHGGDIVYLSGGSADSSQNYSTIVWRPVGGTDLDHRVTYKVGQDPAHNGTVIFDGSENSSQYGVILPSFTIISGNVNGGQKMKAQSYSAAALYIKSSSGIKIEYLDIRGPIFLDADSSSGVYDENIEISHNHLMPSPGSDHAIFAGGLSGGGWDVNSIHDNLIEVASAQNGSGYGDDGIKWGNSLSIYNNIFRTYYDANPGKQHQDFIQTGGAYQKIYNNLFENSDQTDIFFSTPDAEIALNHIRVYNNVFTLTKQGISRGIARGIESNAVSSVNDLIIDNNTFIDITPISAISILATRTVPVGNSEIKNNIIYDSGSSGFAAISAVPGIVVDNNLVDAGLYGQGSGGTATWGGVPNFVYYVPYSLDNDFHLRAADTVARFGAENLSSFFNFDKDNFPRPSSGAWDIGAYQYAANANCADPSAFFTTSSANGYAPLVSFDASDSEACSGSITGYFWNFGDGNEGSGRTMAHTFLTGTYTVKLTITNTSGQTSLISRTITVLPEPVPGIILGVNFDNNIQDWSGKNNTVAWAGEPCYTPDKIGAAGCFNSNSKLLVTPDPFNNLLEARNMTAVSVAGWAKKSTAGLGGGIFGKAFVYNLVVKDVGFYSSITTANGTVRATSVSLVNADTAWHHYAMTYDGSKIILYLDGFKAAEQLQAGAIAANPQQIWYIGENPFGHTGDGIFSGALDDVRVYNIVLSASDVQALYNGTVQPPPDALAISNISSEVTSSTATITWDTNAAATSQVSYGLTSVYGSQTAEDSTLATAHSQAISGLLPNTIYHFKITSTDGNGQSAESDDQTFTTSPLGGKMVLHLDFSNDWSGSGSITNTSDVGNAATCQTNFQPTAANLPATYNQCPAKVAGPLSGTSGADFNGSVCRLDSKYLAILKTDSLTNLSQGAISLWINFNPTTDPNFQIPFTDFGQQRVLDTLSPSAGTWVLGKSGLAPTYFTIHDPTRSSPLTRDSNNNVQVLQFPDYIDANGNVGVNGSWHLYTITWDGASIKGYYDGRNFQTSSQAGLSALNIGTYLTIGALNFGVPQNDTATSNCNNYYSSSIAHYGYPANQQYTMPNAGFFEGKLADIRIYNRPLSASEVSSIYIGVTATPPPPPPPPASGGGSSGGGNSGGGIITTYCSGVIYREWSQCNNGFQQRIASSSLPTGCSLTAAEQADSSRTCVPATPEVLGVKVNNPEPSAKVALTQLEQIQVDAAATYNNNKFVALNSLTKELYINLRKKKPQALTERDKFALAYYIHNGTPTTAELGAGERAGVLNSYLSVFDKLPDSENEWQDVIKIANGRWPAERDLQAEKAAERDWFIKIYRRPANLKNVNDNAAISIITYGLSPVSRKLKSEQAAIRIFKAIFLHNPLSAADWNVARAIAYSGAKR